MTRSFLPLVMLIVGALLGVLSAGRMLDGQAQPIPGEPNGWREWRGGEDSLRNTYSIGHYLSKGQIPPPKGVRYFVRNTDDEGQTLRGSCAISIEGKFPLSRWWFAAAVSGDERTTLDAGQAVRQADGTTVIAIASAPAQGNWLAPPNDATYELQFVLLGVDESAVPTPGGLPRVRKLGC